MNSISVIGCSCGDLTATALTCLTFGAASWSSSAGGTGLSPVRGVIEHFYENPSETSGLTVISGFKSPQDVLFKGGFGKVAGTDEVNRHRGQGGGKLRLPGGAGYLLTFLTLRCAMLIRQKPS